MMGAAGLKGPGAAAAFARQRLTMVPRSTRSISTFRSQRLRIPGQGRQLTLASSGSGPWRTASIAVGPAAVRFNSSSSNPTPSPTPETTTQGDAPDVGDLSSFDLSSIPEQIGYLKELGLDYGWGPTAIMQYVIEHVHIWTGLPWWASVVCAGLAVRVALLKPMLDASDQSARLHNAKAETTPLRQEMMRAVGEHNQVEVHRKRAEISRIHAERGINALKSFIPMLQIPFGYGMFRCVRGMSSLPIPGLTNESLLWLNDMTVPDPMYALPAFTCYAMYLAFKKGGESGTMDFMTGSAGKTVLVALPTVSFGFMAFQPAALQLYFAATGAWALAQSYLINNVAFRKALGMTIISDRVTTTLDVKSPSTGLALLERRLADEQRHFAELRKAKTQGQEAPAGKISFIDRWMNRSKKSLDNITTDASDKIRNWQGKSTTNADGSPARTSRLTDAERKAAEEYENERKTMDIYTREERNHARRQAHMQALKTERAKAKSAWQKQQEAAVNRQTKRRK